MTNKPTHLLTLADFDSQQIEAILQLALQMKSDPSKYGDQFKGKAVATLFEKQSLRTRVSLEVGVAKMGGHAVYLDQQHGAMGKRESIADFARNLSRWVDVIVARVFDHQTLVELAKYSSKPVVNSLCDLYHPCQALADMLTLKEHFGELAGLKLVYVGEGNNVSNSLMIAGAKLGVQVTVVTPQGYEPEAEIVKQAVDAAINETSKPIITNDLSSVSEADAVYTDTWFSMGSNADRQQILKDFADYQVDSGLMNKLGAKAFMHCQPVHREEEATTEVVDGEQSVMMDQAENRMWAQNAALALLDANEI